jgi:PiT family inorganic phosphate transporter
MSLEVIVFLVALALAFDFMNGFHDAANSIATIVSTRVLRPHWAVVWAAFFNFAALAVFGVAVAATVGKGIIDAAAVDHYVVFGALVGAIAWNVITWYYGIPSSSSHALIGGIAGAALSGFGVDALKWAGLGKVLIALLTSPLLGLAAGYLLMKTIVFLAQGATPRINTFFKRAQIGTALALALSHGTNDAQKTMGIITLGLVASGVLPAFLVPTWVIALSASAIALGTSLGGWRLIRTLGARFYTIRPVHGFTAQVASATVIMGAALLGGPVSTTQVVASSILGAGSGERLSKVRWGVAEHVATAWLLTIPISALLAAGIYALIRSLAIFAG